MTTRCCNIVGLISIVTLLGTEKPLSLKATAPGKVSHNLGAVIAFGKGAATSPLIFCSQGYSKVDFYLSLDYCLFN